MSLDEQAMIWVIHRDFAKEFLDYTELEAELYADRELSKELRA